ncbi:alcohol dehydrogenase [Cladophialophora carrionii]|uniref:Alcohol dehydrogenase n=1 Tax=Cladophialophora carrionii TaxID=86049 RepID=A0A1C1CQQ3_9EURO|nr:alcohol dehydrogenase [Cladophialophora carrionii]
MANANIPKTMRAQVLEQYESPYQLQELPMPTIDDPNDILIKVDAASYCHTDAVLASGRMHPPPLPHIGCHEFAGTVISVSDRSHGLKVGDRVAVPGRGYHVCGKCLECQNPSGPVPDEPGYSVYCANTGGGLGVGNRPGGFREYAVVDSRQVAVIPDSMTAVEAAPLMCAGLTIYAALRKCELRPGQRVGIIGCGGGLGHLGLQFATKMGLRTTGIDVTPQALELARSLQTGATIVDASAESAEDVKRRMGNEDGGESLAEMGLDAVIILPDSQKAWDYGMGLLKNGGLLVLVSFPPEGFHVSADDLVFRRIRVIGSLIGSNKAMNEMFEFVVRNDVKARIRTYPFAKLNELVEDYHAGAGGKLVIDMSLKQ